MMNTKLIIGAAAGWAIAAVAASAATRCPGERESTMWDKMRQRMEEMPDDFPPRVMFDNVAATKSNTEQILALLKTAHERADNLVTSS